MAKKANTKLDSTSYANKKDALKAAFDKIKKDHGDESISLFSDKPSTDILSTQSGSLNLDIALGIGGYPRGRMIEIMGPFSSGKSTLMLHAIAEAQKQGGTCAYIDAEHALDPVYAAAIGVNMDDLIFSQPATGEQALQIAETLITSGATDLIVIDSVAALVPKAEIEGEIGDSNVGLQARLMSQACRKFASLCNTHNTTLLFVNQIRMKIGVMFGNPETGSGGEALKFFSSVRMEIRKVGALKDGDEAFGIKSKVKIIKNKVAPPFKEVEMDIIFGKGVDRMGEVLDIAEQMELVERAGAWYSHQGERIGQGRDNTVEYLRAHPELAASLESAIRTHYKLKTN